jgi:hypothetical protein
MKTLINKMRQELVNDDSICVEDFNEINGHIDAIESLINGRQSEALSVSRKENDKRVCHPVDGSVICENPADEDCRTCCLYY